MSVLLFIFGILFTAGGFLMFVIAKGAIHEIEGLLCFLMSLVSFSASFIMDAIKIHSQERKDEHLLTAHLLTKLVNKDK
jgi:hypothetical protein